MGFFSRLFGKKKNDNIRQREGNPDVVNIASNNEAMNWAIEKAQLTLHYFESCLTTPKPGQQYFSIKVKIIENERTEHLWLTEPSFDSDGNLFGVVGNNPIDIKNLKLNQKIGIDKNLVTNWMIVENGRLIGGYTIRAIRDGLTEKELVNFDKSLGGIYVDEGEDCFLPSFDTPEGAIMSIETAYTENNLEKAISCKDFEVEARLMLKKMNVDIQSEEIIQKTAELLYLSFVKEIQDNGMPNMSGIKRAFPSRQKINDNHYIITEVCIYPDGSKSHQKLNTYKTASGWKVLNPAN